MLALTIPTISPGTALPTKISAGRSGVTNSCSNVPSSRSRASDNALTSIDIIKDSTATRPGRMNHLLSSVGLNQSRTSIATGAAPALV